MLTELFLKLFVFQDSFPRLTSGLRGCAYVPASVNPTCSCITRLYLIQPLLLSAGFPTK